MTPRRLSSLAGAAALAAAVTAGAFALAQNTQPTQPSPSTPRPQPVSPSTPSKPSNPAQPTNPNNPSNPNNPNNPSNPNNPDMNPADQPIEPPLTRQPGDTTGTRAQRLFMLETNQEARFNEFSSRLTRLDQQLTTSNEQLMRELGDARMAGDTNARLDKLASILQKSLQHDKQLQAEINEIRMALTGTGASTPGAPGANPPTTTPRTPSTPPSPNNPTNPPRPGGPG